MTKGLSGLALACLLGCSGASEQDAQDTSQDGADAKDGSERDAAASSRGTRDSATKRDGSGPRDESDEDEAPDDDDQSDDDSDSDGGVESDGGGASEDQDSDEEESACGHLDGSEKAAVLHQAALDVLSPMSPCGFSSCHANPAKGGLSLLDATDLRALLVGQPACEAPALSLVDGSGGDEALARSFLWLKMTANADEEGALEPEPSYGEPGSCGQRPDQPFGVLMPLGSDALEEARLAPIRDWICAGAPGP